MDFHLLYIIAIIGAGCLIASFVKMKTGFGPFNLRVIGIVLVATFATLLAVVRQDSLNSAMGILGAIAGYIFGIQENKEKVDSSSVDVDSSKFGHNAKIAGRDINETIEKMSAEVANINNQINNIEKNVSETIQPSNKPKDFLINTIFERDHLRKNTAMENVIRHWELYGWEFIGLSSDYQGIDGMILIFTRNCKGNVPTFESYHGSEMEKMHG